MLQFFSILALRQRTPLLQKEIAFVNYVSRVRWEDTLDYELVPSEPDGPGQGADATPEHPVVATVNRGYYGSEVGRGPGVPGGVGRCTYGTPGISGLFVDCPFYNVWRIETYLRRCGHD